MATYNGTNGEDSIDGSDNNDLIYGYGGLDYLYGNDGNDVIRGGGGDDRIFGGVGSDELYGEPGRDLLFGYYPNIGNEIDYLTGGADSDIFMLGDWSQAFYLEPGSHAVILDFQKRTDRLELHGDQSQYSLGYSRGFTWQGQFYGDPFTDVYKGNELIARILEPLSGPHFNSYDVFGNANFVS